MKYARDNISLRKYEFSFTLLVSLVLMMACDDSGPTDNNIVIISPSGLTDQALSPSSIQLRWTDNSDNEENFVINRNTGEYWEEIAILPANSVSHIDSLLEENTTYTYYVEATNETSESEPTPTLSITTPSWSQWPGIPSNPSPPDNEVIEIGGWQLEWECTDPDGDSLSYDVYFGASFPLPLIASGIRWRYHYFPGNFDYGTTYYWQIIAKDNMGRATPGPIWSFHTLNDVRLVGTYSDQSNSYCRTFAIDNYLYIASQTSGLQIVDVTDPSSPALVGSNDTPQSAQDVVVAGNYAYLADGAGALMIFDVTNPNTPSLIGNIIISGYPLSLFIEGSFAYLPATYSGLNIIDISDPSNPQIEGNLAISGGDLIDIYVKDNYAYIAKLDSGFQIIDVTDPANPTSIGNFNTYCRALYPFGNYLLIGSRRAMVIYDIANPVNPLEIGAYPIYHPIDCIYVSGDYAYLAKTLDGFQILNMSDPANPILIGIYDNLYYAFHASVRGNYVYLSGSNDDILILEFIP